MYYFYNHYSGFKMKGIDEVTQLNIMGSPVHAQYIDIINFLQIHF